MKTIASRIYGAAVDLRNAAYDNGWLRSSALPVPVISVGNITAGGTGKTPVVERLVEYCLSTSRKPAVISRGYKRDTKGSTVVSDGRGNIVDARSGGDEPVQIAKKFPDVVVIADARRLRGCRRAIAEFGCDIILLDDAYQHRAVSRSADIVVLDASSELYAQRLLPAGRLREPMVNLSRADILLLSRCEADVAHEHMAMALRAFSTVPVFATRFIPQAIRRVRDGQVFPPVDFSGKQVISFCGIGSPSSYRRTLDALGVVSISHEDFPDHHRFTPADIDSLKQAVIASGNPPLFTTEKDAMRLSAFTSELQDVEVLYPVMRVEFLGGEDEFFSLIEIKAKRPEDQPK